MAIINYSPLASGNDLGWLKQETKINLFYENISLFFHNFCVYICTLLRALCDKPHPSIKLMNVRPKIHKSMTIKSQ